MMRVLIKGIVGLVVVLVVLVAGLFVYARSHDGPIALIPGGPLEAGELVGEVPDDWGFAADVEEVELQLAYEDSSRTTWIVVSEGAAFIPCSLSFPPGKRWHLAADADGTAIVRISGKRYAVALERVKDDARAATVAQAIAAKYPAAAGRGGEGLWVFELRPRGV